MKFSIVIPAFNEEDYIATTLEAVLRQTYGDFEVIVVNNNSTDDTVNIVSLFKQKDTRIRLVSCPQKGLLFARNHGFKVSLGDIIVQLDADNTPPANWLENGARHLQNSDYQAVIGAHDYNDGNVFFRYLGLFFQYVFLSAGNYYVQKMKFGALMVGGNAFIRKSALEKVGGYDTSYNFYNDDLVTASAIAKIGWVQFYRDLTVLSSARRYKEVGYMKLQGTYNKGTWAILTGKPVPHQPEELYHPR